MHIPALLVPLHGPEEQRLTAALFFPSLPDVLLLLLVLLNQMLAFPRNIWFLRRGSRTIRWVCGS
jgi:hypothetical protein